MDSKKALNEFGFKFCRSILKEGASYASIILSNEQGVLYSYSTNKTWEGLYHESGFSKSCHLIVATKRIAENHNSFTLFWDSVAPNNEISHYLDVKRREKNICHGVSFCKKNSNGVLEILTIAGRYCDLNFSKQVISHTNEIQMNLLGLKNELVKHPNL